jgi:hydroxypyruvate isomerase
MACLPGRTEKFQDSVKLALEYAAALDCTTIHCMAGLSAPGVAPPTLAAVYANNLKLATEQAHAAGIKIVIEPINHRDMPKYFLANTKQAAGVIEAIGRDRLGLQFDIYHCQITEGDITKRLEALMPVIAHMQIADVPARHEPGTGEINWAFVFPRIDELGYQGWVGCEYRPAKSTVEGLGWRKAYGV